MIKDIRHAITVQGRRVKAGKKNVAHAVRRFAKAANSSYTGNLDYLGYVKIIADIKTGANIEVIGKV